jgi:hypothetical protein
MQANIFHLVRSSMEDESLAIRKWATTKICLAKSDKMCYSLGILKVRFLVLSLSG